jgi:hypothetical protein
VILRLSRILAQALGTSITYAPKAFSLDILASALILLLLIGIRNAWDMTMWIMDHRGRQ